MSDVFWNDLDAMLVSTFTAQMGSGSAYSTQRLATVNSKIFADAHEYSTWPMPALAAACYDVLYSATEHMGAEKRLYTRTYKCMVWAIISGTYSATADTVTEETKTMYERVEKVLREQPFSVTAGGAKSRWPLITRGALDIARFPSDPIDSNRRMGLAVFMFDIQAKV